MFLRSKAQFSQYNSNLRQYKCGLLLDIIFKFTKVRILIFQH